MKIFLHYFIHIFFYPVEKGNLKCKQEVNDQFFLIVLKSKKTVSRKI